MNGRHLLDLFNVVKDFRLFVAMIKDKRYKIPLARKLTYAVLVIYIVSPVDFIPALLLPFAGWVDDLGAFSVIVGVLLYEIASYRDFAEGKETRRRAPQTDAEKRISETIKSVEGPRFNKAKR